MCSLPIVSAEEPSAAARAALERADAKLRRAIMFAVLMTVVIGGATAVIFVVTAPKGEAIGSLQLERDAAESRFDLQAGDTLRFSFDLRSSGSEVPDHNRSQTAGSFYDAKLSLTLRAPDGSEETTRCDVYNGVHGGQRSSPSEWSMTGVQNGCTFTVEQAGSHTLAGNVDWAGVTPSHASLQVLLADE